jgi:hypothetical protein
LVFKTLRNEISKRRGQVIKPAANQFEALIAKIKDGRRKVELSGEPWFHRMLVGRGNVK